MTAEGEDYVLSSLDRRVIALLAEDARQSFAEIGGQVGLSASATKRRVDRLVAQGVIVRFTLELQRPRQAQGVEAYIELYCRGRTAPQDILATVQRHPEVVMACTVTGDADAIARVRARDVPHLEQVLEEIRSEPNVERTKSVLVLTQLVDRDQSPELLDVPGRNRP